ncbi:MAG: hypothetical protein Ct9H300mP14_00910 [Gammaproteobacteria bacterium]|nr:MAG: hypothetical protein Ct9H300mP14_00910 [Gammaproteobacteria bacterium]
MWIDCRLSLRFVTTLPSSVCPRRNNTIPWSRQHQYPFLSYSDDKRCAASIPLQRCRKRTWLGQLLESAAINARVFNENAQGAIGELPVTDAWPDVWIVQNHQFHAARAVIERYEASSEDELLCNSCGEIPPRQF